MIYQDKLGNASICKWTLSFEFKTTEQCVKFIDLVFKEEMNIPYSFTFESDGEANFPTYTITIHQYSWAANLKRISELLEQVDWSEDNDKDTAV